MEYRNTLMTLTDLCKELVDTLAPSARNWFNDGYELLNNSPIDDLEDTVLTLSVVARRHCGDTAFLPIQTYNEMCFNTWSVTDAARIALFLIALTRIDEKNTLLKNLYRYGDEPEKAALLKGLNLLDPNGGQCTLAINACRVNSLEVYSAIALHNPYPALYFPEHNWNQLILKSLFQHLDISQIYGLQKKSNCELSSMVLSYAEELVLAERIPPPSIWLALKLSHLDDSALTMIERFLCDPDVKQRHSVLESIEFQYPPPNEISPKLIEHLKTQSQREADNTLKSRIEALLH